MEQRNLDSLVRAKCAHAIKAAEAWLARSCDDHMKAWAAACGMGWDRGRVHGVPSVPEWCPIPLGYTQAGPQATACAALIGEPATRSAAASAVVRWALGDAP